MTLSKGFVKNAATTPLDARLMDAGRLVCNRNRTVRTGVLSGFDGYGSPTNLVRTTGTMNLIVSAAAFVVSKGAADGAVILYNDGDVNVAVTAAPPSNSRIDVLWVKQNDDQTGDATNDAVFGVTAGTAAAIPNKPSIPTGATELATLRVYASTTATNGGSNTLTETYQMTTARGGRVAVRTIAERDAWTNPEMGQIVDVRDSAEVFSSWQWDGSKWSYLGTCYARLSASTGWNIADSAVTYTVMSLAAGDLIGPVAVSTGTGATITVDEAGTYRVMAYALYASNGSGKRELAVFVNGSIDPRLRALSLAAGNNVLPLAIAVDVALSAGSVLDLRGLQTTGAGNLLVSDRFLSVQRVA